MSKYSNVFLGPWGGEEGVKWHYHPINGTITRISITSDDNAIYSINFISRDINGNFDQSPVFGAPAGTRKELNIDPSEKLVLMEGIVGTYNSLEVVTQLSFSTMKNGVTTKHRAYGSMQKGAKFSCPLSSEDSIAGFHGRSGQFLNSIGVSVVAKSRKVVPLWGGAGGLPWSYTTAGQISHISITYSDIIHAIRFKSKEAHGDSDHSDTFGSSKSDAKYKYNEINFDAKTGNLIGIWGTYGTYDGATVVTSLAFTTNNYRTYGPFGTKIGTHFNYMVNEKEVIAGFHGRGDRSKIDAIGLYKRSIDLSRNAVFVGPIGGASEIKWEYRPKGLISRITINYTSRLIYSIRFESKDEQGNIDQSPLYGKEYKHGNFFNIDIDGEVGKLNGIMGTINAQHDKEPIIGSLCFSTEKKIIFGPFGNPNTGTHFSITMEDGFINGFHGAGVGNNEFHLHSIGVYVNPL